MTMKYLGRKPLKRYYPTNINIYGIGRNNIGTVEADHVEIIVVDDRIPMDKKRIREISQWDFLCDPIEN